MMAPEQDVITPGVVVPEPPPDTRDPEASTSRADVIPPYDDLDADPPFPVETRPGKRKKKVAKRRSAPPPDADETDSADADHEGQGGILLVTEVETTDPHPDAEKGNRPVDGPVSWQEEPCRSCHRPYNTAPPREVWVAYGMDAQGRIIEYKYIRARTADGTSRRLRPEDAWKFDVQDARITEDGMLVFGQSNILDRRPTSDELIQYITGIRQWRRPVQAIWARKPPTGRGPSNARKRAETHHRHEAEGDETPPKIPRYIPPGCRLVPFVSFMRSDSEVTVSVTSVLGLQPADLSMFRVGDVFRIAPEVRTTVLEMIEEYDAATTLQDIEPPVHFARGHGIPVGLSFHGHL